MLCRWGSARIRVLMKKRTLASPLLNAALLRRFARPRWVRKVFGAKGERVRTSAAYPLVLTVMRRRVPELQICDVSAEPGSTRCSTRASERCAMFDSWQIMSAWNERRSESQIWASHVSMTTGSCCRNASCMVHRGAASPWTFGLSRGCERCCLNG